MSRSLLPWPRRCAAGQMCVTGHVPGRIYPLEPITLTIWGAIHEACLLARPSLPLRLALSPSQSQPSAAPPGPTHRGGQALPRSQS